MKGIRNIIDGKSAFQAADLSDILMPVGDEEREKLQQLLVEIYKDILSFCGKNNWTPYLVGGSALGAIRHKGFIPWDDDLDLGMMREEYNAFLDAFEKEYAEKYIVNAPGKGSQVKARFAKIIRKGTLFQEFLAVPDDAQNGVFVDIFPMDHAPDSLLIRGIKGVKTDCLAYISSQVFSYYYRNRDYTEALKRTGRINYFVRTIIGAVFGVKNPDWWFARYDKSAQCHQNRALCCTIAAGRKHYFGEVMERAKIEPPRYVDFCDIKAPVFNDVEAYLSHMYGDYMEIPPENKREKHYIVRMKV